jgi:hypothetical protein
MRLSNWQQNGWPRPHRTTPEEIPNLWQIARRDIKDAEGGGVSVDW